MKQNMLNKKRNLKPGEMIELCYDEAFKIMFANTEHLEILTVLLSRILKIEYKDLEGKVSLLPLKNSNKTIGEKKQEKDVLVSIKTRDKYKLVLEINVKKKFYESVTDRNLYYSFEVAGRSLPEGESYSNLGITLLINFNTYFTDLENKKVFDEYLLRNEEGNILSKKFKVFNINIAECHNLWYHNEYQGKFELYEEDLMLLCAAMKVSKQEDFKKIIDLVRIKPEIKELMEGVVSTMNENEELVGSYLDWKEENEKINQAIIEEEKAESFKEGIKQGIEQGNANKQKEIVLNMYNKNFKLEDILSITNLTLEEVETIINTFNNDTNK